MNEQQTTIAMLQKYPVGERTGGFKFSIKTFKKRWQVGKIWWQQVVLVDKVGKEMPADVMLGPAYAPLVGREIHIVVGEVQEAEYLGKDRKKLVVHEYKQDSITADELPELGSVVTGNIIGIKCHLAAGLLSNPALGNLDKAVELAESDEMKKLIDWIVK